MFLQLMQSHDEPIHLNFDYVISYEALRDGSGTYIALSNGNSVHVKHSPSDISNMLSGYNAGTGNYNIR